MGRTYDDRDVLAAMALGTIPGAGDGGLDIRRGLMSDVAARGHDDIRVVVAGAEEGRVVTVGTAGRSDVLRLIAMAAVRDVGGRVVLVAIAVVTSRHVRRSVGHVGGGGIARSVADMRVVTTVGVASVRHGSAMWVG